MTAVPQAPAIKHIARAEPEPAKIDKMESEEQKRVREGVTFEADPQKLSWIDKIRTFDRDVKSFASRIKLLNKDLQEIIEATPGYDEVERLTNELEIAKKKLSINLKANREYMELTEELADEALSLKDAKGNLSEFILGWFHDTGEKQIDLGGEGRELIIRGRLGKKQDYQTNLFSDRIDR